MGWWKGSSLLLGASTLCWAACYLVFTAQSFGSNNLRQNSDSCYDLFVGFMHLPFFGLMISFLIVLPACDSGQDNTGDSNDVAHANATERDSSPRRVERLICIALPFLLIHERSYLSTDHVTFPLNLALYTCFHMCLASGGFVGILTMRYYKDNYQKFLWHLTGIVVRSCYGFGHAGDGLFKVVICLLSAAMVFLCRMSLSLYDKELAAQRLQASSRALKSPMPRDYRFDSYVQCPNCSHSFEFKSREAIPSSSSQGFLSKSD